MYISWRKVQYFNSQNTLIFHLLFISSRRLSAYILRFCRYCTGYPQVYKKGTYKGNRLVSILLKFEIENPISEMKDYFFSGYKCITIPPPSANNVFIDVALLTFFTSLTKWFKFVSEAGASV